MKRPSPALVVAFLALLVALGGTALAGTGAFSSGGTKVVKKVANRQIDKRLPWTGKDIDIPSLGLTPHSVVRQSTRTLNLTVGQNENVTASCLPGEHATGGGGSRGSIDLDLKESYPIYPGLNSTATGWRVTYEWEASANLQITAFAICESP